MTKKHFKEFAELFRQMKSDAKKGFLNFEGNTQTALLNGLCRIFEKHNSRFNQQVFLDYINKD